MFRESIKWMFITLLAALLTVAAVLYAPNIRALTAAREEAAAATLAPTKAPAPTPPPTSTAAPTPTPSPEPTETPVTLESWLTEYVANMPMEEKLGQMALFGFSGKRTPNNGFTANQRDYRVGNIILYGANISSGNSDGGSQQASELIANARENMVSDIPPFVALDVEGGTVVRFHWPSWPLSARSLGKRDPAFAYEQYYINGQRLLETGVNLGLAPVLDVSLDPMRTFLRTRIISADADVAAAVGTAIIQGLHDAGCLATAKHFPGHGGTTADSHDTTPIVDKSAEALFAYDLVPFISAIEADVDAILVAHILFPAFDETDIASMSEPVITGLLRDTLGFSGVVVSDDFRMGGLTTRYQTGDAAVRFVLAGGDMILCGAQYDRQAAIMQALTEAVQKGTIPAERIDESVYRILLTKIRRGVWDVDAFF